jgi:hypothetical protein
LTRTVLVVCDCRRHFPQIYAGKGGANVNRHRRRHRASAAPRVRIRLPPAGSQVRNSKRRRARQRCGAHCGATLKAFLVSGRAANVQLITLCFIGTNRRHASSVGCLRLNRRRPRRAPQWSTRRVDRPHCARRASPRAPLPHDLVSRPTLIPPVPWTHGLGRAELPIGSLGFSDRRNVVEVEHAVSLGYRISQT